MARTLAEKITIADADGTHEKPYPLLSWEETPDSDDAGVSGDKVRHVRRYWGGGMGETVELARGGYYYSENAYHGDPFALKPRPSIGTVVLTGNNVPITQMFEAESASKTKFLYALSPTKVHKVQISGAPTLKNTRDFTTPNVEFATGSYIGTGDFQWTPSTTFPIKAVIVKAIDGAYAAALKTNDTTDGIYWFKKASGTYTTGSVSNGLQIDSQRLILWGSDTSLNHAGTTYCWMAFGGDYVKVGRFNGDGLDNRDITVEAAWGQPDALFIFTNNNADYVCFRNKTDVADSTCDLCTIGTAANIVQATAGWPVDGFEVGSNNRANRPGTDNVFYIAMKGAANILEIGSYVGNGLDATPIVAPAFPPTYAIIYTDSGTAMSGAVHRSDHCSGDSTMTFDAVVNAADKIESLDALGFTVGTHVSVNENLKTYYYFVIRPDPAYAVDLGQPAKWNGTWELPMGPIVAWAGLTAIVDGVGDDTYTTRAALYATHFCTLQNKFARADENSKIRLCAADDVSVAGNWGAGYAVGPPDTVITRLVEWSDELSVSHTGGMYMFDGVATSKEQLPLLGGLKDDDNGKGTLRMASFIFYPSADGLWRWAYGSHKRVDPDADRFYVKAIETTNEPLNLKHYGSAFCGDHVYHACYDGTNYLLMHGKLNEEGEFVWDCLLSTTTEIKVLYLDSDRYLWFNYGNDLAYIVLSQGGEADGGTFGDASLVTTIYSREIVLAEDAECRLRMVKVIVRQMPGATFMWQIYASRDGGTFAQVGTDVTTDGVNKRYFAPASNLTARRIRLKYIGTATAGFAPDATPPEIIFEGVYGETKPDDAETVKAVINLDGERAAETVYAELKARENAGVVKVRHPINNTMLSMIIYGVALANLRQKGYEEPVAVAIVSMRRGDTA